jgi:hypothetical protein
MTIAPTVHAPPAPREAVATPPRFRSRFSWRVIAALAMDLALAAVAVVVSIVVQPWVDGLGVTKYREFLRMETLLVQGGKGFQLDLWSFPLAPALHVGTALLAGEHAAERWLPIALSAATVFVLNRVLLRDYPLLAKVLATLPVLASPYFYAIQRQLDLQLFVLLLALQLSTLRAFRQRPTVARVSVAIGLNILLSLTSYAALVAILAAVAYLVILSYHQREVQAAAWRALLWLYVPFSLTGYVLWLVFWLIAGSRVKTSYFLPSGATDLSYARQLVAALGGAIVLPVLLLLGLVVVLRVFLASPEPRIHIGQNQALAWAVLAFMGIALALFSLQTVAHALLIQPEAITLSLVLFLPAAVVSAFTQMRGAFRAMQPKQWIILAAATVAVIAIFPLQYVLRPDARGEHLLPTEQRVAAEQAAAAKFAAHDPGGRVLLDPRFTATFARDAGIDPHRLLTPFDGDFKKLAKSPPADVRTLVVTDTLDDFAGGNYSAERLLDILPDATLIGDGKAGDTFVRAFHRDAVTEPTQDAPQKNTDPALTKQEDTILAAVEQEMQKRGGLPIRPDGWAYAVDVGNLMVYASERGKIDLFEQLSGLVKKYYLVTDSNDPNALYTVAWRAAPDHPREASGTTETLRMVEAYWNAGERWNNDYYRRLAYAMARAYEKHQYSDQYGENWFIRNYYNYGTKEYATNTFLVDYAPDVLRRVADGMHDPDLRAVADKSAQFVEQAQVDFGFFHEMYQPEISTLYANVKYFSPNGIIQIIDSHEAALGIAQIYAPDAARRTYAFAKDQYLKNNGAVANQYLLNGSPYGSTPDTSTEAVYAFMARLSIREGDLPFARQLIDQRMPVEQLYSNPHALPDQDGNWFFSWSTVLLSIREYENAAG